MSGHMEGRPRRYGTGVSGPAPRLIAGAAALIVLACSAAPAVALAQAAPSCRHAETTAGARKCLSDRLREADKELELYLAAARRDASTPAALDRAQAAWASYRDAACRAAAGQFEGGSLQPVVALDCRLRLTRERTLEVWRAYLSNGGTLPEPGAGKEVTQ